jgi:hypothetical protein
MAWNRFAEASNASMGEFDSCICVLMNCSPCRAPVVPFEFRKAEVLYGKAQTARFAGAFFSLFFADINSAYSSTNRSGRLCIVLNQVHGRRLSLVAPSGPRRPSTARVYRGGGRTSVRPLPFLLYPTRALQVVPSLPRKIHSQAGSQNTSIDK